MFLQAGKALLDISIIDDNGETTALRKDVGQNSDSNDGGVFAIKLLKAKDLLKSDSMSKRPDPYAIIRHGSQTYTTKVHQVSLIIQTLYL